MTYRTFGLAAGLGLALVMAAPAPAQATVIRDAAIELVSSQFPPPGRQLVSLFLHQILDDNRQATAIAYTPKGGLVKAKGKKTSFFGDTGLVHAKSEDLDTPAEANAWSRNKWIGKVARAKADPKVSYAVASLWWKDRVVFKHDTRDPAMPAQAPLPDPDIVEEAYLIVPWSIEMNEVGASSDFIGRYEVSLDFNGIDVFSGAVRYSASVNGGMPEFSGDLIGYESAFSLGPTMFESGDLTLSGEARLPIDYQSFYDTEEVYLDQGGRMLATAATVPLPGSGLLGLSALAGLAVMRRRRGGKIAG